MLLRINESHLSLFVHQLLFFTSQLFTKMSFVWWGVENGFKYPRVAVGARKWLSVCSTSTPSERVFSICELVDTPKRSKLPVDAIHNQVFIHSNWKSLNVSLNSP